MLTTISIKNESGEKIHFESSNVEWSHFNVEIAGKVHTFVVWAHGIYADQILACGVTKMLEWSPCKPNPAAQPQPTPLPGSTEVLPLVISDLEARAVMGEKKYGTRLMVENGRDHLEDAWQEWLDYGMYLRAALEQQRRKHAGR